MADPAAILADASAHGASMSHVRGLYALVPIGPVVAESLYLETCGIVQMLQDEIDCLRSKVETERARWREMNEAEETLRSRERERANEWLSLLHDLRNVAQRGLTGDATSADIEHVIACVDAALVRS